MGRFLRFSIVATALLLSMACFLTQCGTNNNNNNVISNAPTVVSLVVQAQPNTYNAVGQTIAYNYIVTNTGTSKLAGPVSIMDDKAIVVTCPDLKTIGNKNGDLENGETITCTGGYAITQADINNGSITNRASATVGGQSSSSVATTVQAQLNKVLTIAAIANPTTYSAANQNITYTYTITNTGQATLGPAQFVVIDSRFPNPINCGSNATTLATNQTVACTAVYTTNTTDAAQCQISSTVNASGAGAGTIQPVTVTVTNPTGFCGGTPAPNLTPGTTIQITIAPNDWLLQLSRCFGASFKNVQSANPQIYDPDVIYPGTRVSIPNIGSAGPIYGPPCVVIYKAVSGDSWQSIATKYNAAVDILIAANPGKSVSPGVSIKVPVNSKGYGTGSITPMPIPTTALPPTVQPTVATPNQPTRLNFPAGNPSSVSQPGTITTPGTIHYVFAGTAGQTVNARLTVPTNDVSMAIYGPNNIILKAPDTVNTWSGPLSLTGDYFIDLISSTGATSKTYTLDVTLTTPTPASNAERVADIYPGTGSSNPSWLSAFNAQLFFQANGNNGFGEELWKYDRGTNAAALTADIYPGSGSSKPTSLRPYQNMLYFGANGNDGAGNELWRYNGSAAGRVNDLFSGPESSNPMYMTEFNGELYFSANGNNGAGVELWKYNGSTSATTMAADINQGPGNSNPSYLAVYNNALYFAATTTNGGTELWKFDGTTATLAADITPGTGNGNPAFLAVFNNLLYFSANGNNGAGTELWKFDGTTASMAADINPGPNDSAPTYMTLYNNALFFGANGNNSGFELWKFNGTTASMAADINPTGSSNPAYLAIYNNELYFQADGNDGAGVELWRYKGS